MCVTQYVAPTCVFYNELQNIEEDEYRSAMQVFVVCGLIASSVTATLAFIVLNSTIVSIWNLRTLAFGAVCEMVFACICLSVFLTWPFQLSLLDGKGAMPFYDKEGTLVNVNVTRFEEPMRYGVAYYTMASAIASATLELALFTRAMFPVKPRASAHVKDFKMQ